MKEKIQNALKVLRRFPKKHHIEYVSALLSIPVILSVLVLNYSNLESRNKNTPPPTPNVSEKTQNPIIIQTSPSTASPTATTSPEVCKKEVGPLSIDYPKENQTVSDDPVCIIIKRDENYCSSVWSYRINSGSWSQYDSNSPCLYNLPEGNIKFSLRAQSTVSSDTTTLERNFIYKTENQTTPTATPSASQ